MVGPPSGLAMDRVPSKAASRRSMPASPPSGGQLRAADAVVADHHGQRLAVVPHPHPGMLRGRVFGGVGQRLGDREVDRGLHRRRRPAGAGRRRPRPAVGGSAPGRATPPASPRSASTGGWMPRTSDAARPARWWTTPGPRRSARRRPPGRGRPVPAPARGSCPGRPAGPARRRAGPVRSAAVRPRSGRRWPRATVSSSPIRCCSRASCGPISSRVVAASVRSSSGEPHQPSGRNGKAISAASCRAKPMVCTSSSQARSRQVARSLSRNRSRANTPPPALAG